MRYVFGEFELDADACELRRAGRRVRVQPKVYHLLRYLIEQRARIVTKDELFAAVWPGEHVSDSALFVCVRSARTAIAQRHSEGHPIATLRGEGYRFIADVRELTEPRSERAADAQEPRDATDPSTARDELIGRKDVMYALSSALGRASAERGQLLLLSGEPGIGKTRCAEALAELAARDGIAVRLARCLEVDGAPAFWPWVQLLRQVAESEPSCAEEARSLLAYLAPTERALRADETDAQAEWTDRFWLFDRAVRLMLQAAEARPSLIVIDDLQWADESSLRLLQLLSAELGRSQCLIVGTVREPLTDESEARGRILRRLTRGATVLQLTGLTEGETAQLVSAVAGAGAARLAPELHAKTAGNPFFLKELLRLSRSDARFERASGVPSGAQLPRVVRDVIRGRLDELDADARAVLRAASVFAGEFDLGVLRRVVGLASDEFFAAVDRALDARSILQGSQPDRFVFAHALVREVVYGELGQTERVRFHRRAAEALEARASGDGWQTEAAHHYHLALADGVHEKALQFARTAATSAMRVQAFDTAARCYRWALAALDYHPRDVPRMRAELTVNLAVATLALGRSTEARDIMRTAVGIAERHGYGDLLSRAGCWLRHNVATAPIPDPFSLDVLQCALALLEPDQRVHRANVLSRLAWIWPNCEDMPKCKALAAEALSLARELDSHSTLLAALAATLYSRTGPDDAEALLETAREVIELERREGTPTWATAQAHFLRYHALLGRCERTAADRALAEFGQVVRRLRLPEPILLHDRICALRSLHQGRLAEAEAQFAEQYERGRRLGLGYAELYYGIQLVLLAWERKGVGDVPSASPAEGLDMKITPSFRAAQLFLLASAGPSPEVVAEWRELARNDFAGVPRDLNYLYAMCLLAQVAVMLEDAPRARVLYEQLQPYAERNTPTLLSLVAGAVSHHLGVLAQFLGERARAVTHFECALALHERLGYLPWAARTRVHYAKALLEQGDSGSRKRARNQLRAARDLGEALGLTQVATSARVLLES